MCYLTIKEMANISEDVIIVTSRFVLYSSVIPCNTGSEIVIFWLVG